MVKRKRVKFDWVIFIQEGKLVIDLNGGLNTAIPLNSPQLQSFKAEKKAEIEFFKSMNKTTVLGYDLLN